MYLFYLVLFFAAMLFYFKIAIHYHIIDKPNERSSHSEMTIRGGGIIFLVAAGILGFKYPQYWLVVIGIFTIGVVSFIDDRISLSNRIRMCFHLLSVTFLFFNLALFKDLPIYIIAALYVVVIGTINAYNFMDGINGITGLYSLVVLVGLQYVNCQYQSFIEPDMIWLPILGCIVFMYFNFRKKAKCFAGDVGSVSIAFWILFLLLKLINITCNFNYIFFLLIYGLDSMSTIGFRLIRKENIFMAHRSHFYQYLANEKKISHLSVSTGYALLQTVVIVFIIGSTPKSFLYLGFTTLVFFLLFIGARFLVEGKEHLLGSNKGNG